MLTFVDLIDENREFQEIFFPGNLNFFSASWDEAGRFTGVRDGSEERSSSGEKPAPESRGKDCSEF